MPHYCLIGQNEFMHSKMLNHLQSTIEANSIVFRQTVSDVYFLVRNSSKLLIICDRPFPTDDYGIFKDVDIGGHHIIWTIENRDQLKELPFTVAKPHIFLCADFSDTKFVKFVQSVLDENKIDMEDDDVLYLVNRLDKDDLYGSYSELLKFIEQAKLLDKITKRDIRWVGNPAKKTSLDLLDAFLKGKGTLGILGNLEFYETPPLLILAFLLEAMEKIILLKIYKARISISDLALRLKAHPYFLSKLDKLSTKLTTDKFIAWHKRLCQIDIGMKYSGVNGYILLKAFFLE